jgi:hypothetical protein
MPFPSADLPIMKKRQKSSDEQISSSNHFLDSWRSEEVYMKNIEKSLFSFLIFLEKVAFLAL